MLNVLMEQMDNAQQQMGNFSREIEIIRKHQMKVLEMKVLVKELKNAFNGFISKLDTTKKRIIEYEDLFV